LPAGGHLFTKKGGEQVSLAVHMLHTAALAQHDTHLPQTNQNRPVHEST
jgi:hypothetical protein